MLSFKNKYTKKMNKFINKLMTIIKNNNSFSSSNNINKLDRINKNNNKISLGIRNNKKDKIYKILNKIIWKISLIISHKININFPPHLYKSSNNKHNIK